jgi:hypothetical protein
MGLDILIKTDNDSEVFSAEYYDAKYDNRSKHNCVGKMW